jgi:hypothetical protein
MFLEKGGERERKEFIAREYIGVIKDIRHIEYHRGNPDILISNEWVFLTLDEQLIFDEIKVGDSIVKKGGSEKIVIYRRDSLDNVRVMEF